GGALASFLAIDIKRYILDPILDERINGIPFNINLTTIGEPRVGNEVYAKIIMNELIFQTTPLKHHVSRITHRNDVITHLPPSKSGFVHHPHEIWVKNIDETYICRDIDYGEPSDDLSCSAGALFFDISVHLFIWDINFTPLCTCDT
ncbi:460_t:CDS:1, partial [Diversispora eburnea]